MAGFDEAKHPRDPKGEFTAGGGGGGGRPRTRAQTARAREKLVAAKTKARAVVAAAKERAAKVKATAETRAQKQPARPGARARIAELRASAREKAKGIVAKAKERASAIVARAKPALPKQVSPKPRPAPSESTPGIKGLAAISSTTKLGGGVNKTFVAHLQDGSKAVWKPSKGESKTDVDGIPRGTQHTRDAATYNLAKVIGVQDVVPETVVTKHGGQEGSLQRWIEGQNVASHHGDVDRDSAEKIRLLDFVAGNSDRHGKNMIVGSDGRASAIDNGLSFPEVPTGPQVPRASSLPFAGRGLTPETHQAIANMDPAAIATSLRESGIEKDAIRHVLYRTMLLKENPETLAVPAELPHLTVSMPEGPVPDRLRQTDWLVKAGASAADLVSPEGRRRADVIADAL